MLISPEHSKEKEQEAARSTNEAPEEQEVQPREQPKPKYVPGPIGALIDQAEVVGLHLTINRQEELEFRTNGRGPIPLTRWGKKAWAKEIKRHINDDLLKELHEAVKPDHDNEGKAIPPRRKDMVGFPEEVDRHATMALLKKTIKQPRQSDNKKGNVLQELDLELDKNPKNRTALHSIVAGSIRPNARLARSHGVKPRCRCGAEKEDVQHVFNTCPDHEHIRKSRTT